MFHLKPKPSPPVDVGPVTWGHDVDSSAIGGDAGGALVDGGVHLLEELHRLEVLAAAVLVRRPLALLARVVEVEHRGDAVDAQPVGVELLEPVERVGVEEVAHLVAAEVEDVRAPLLVPAALGVGVLVERACRRTAASAHSSVAKWPGTQSRITPIAGLVEPVDEQPEAVGVAEPRVRREVRRHVVAPRAAERVLHHRHQLDVGEPQVARRTPAAPRPAAPRSCRAATTRGASRRPTSARARAAWRGRASIQSWSPHA